VSRRAIDAVVLTHDSREQALECIAHLREPEIASVVVVDNASSDGTSEAIRAAHPDVRVLALPTHTGLAAALNRGAAVGAAPFVRYRPRSLPSPAAVVARLLGLERLWPRNPLTGRHLRRALDDRTTVAVDQPAGACLLVRRAVVERVGGWDERYSFWYEDVDFSRRLAAHGTQLYVPAAPFRHLGGATVGRMPRVEGHQRSFHGILLYAQTHFSRPGHAFVALTLAAVGLVRALVAVRGDRQAARIYAATARTAIGALASRPASLP
jgi:GT2 family glycosyltransferase